MLKTVDLALATLSAEWPGVVGKIDAEIARWSKDWPKIDAAFLVRALAAIATDTATLPRLRGVGEATLEDAWERVRFGVEHLLQLLKENAAIGSSALIPSMNALIPLVVLLGVRKGEKLEDPKAVIYWLLGAFVTARYAAAVRHEDRAGLAGRALRRPAARALSERRAAGHAADHQRAAADRKRRRQPVLPAELPRGQAPTAHRTGGMASRSAKPPSAARSRSSTTTSILARRCASCTPRARSTTSPISRSSARPRTRRSAIARPAVYFAELEQPDQLTPHLVPLAETLRTAGTYREFLAGRRRLLADAMTDLLDRYRPTGSRNRRRLTPRERERAVSVTLYEGPSARLLFEANRDGERFLAAAALDDLERFLADARSQLASTLQIGPEQASTEPEDEEITVPVGPFNLTGSADDWETVLQRERLDARPVAEAPEHVDSERYDGERQAFAVIETD